MSSSMSHMETLTENLRQTIATSTELADYVGGLRRDVTELKQQAKDIQARLATLEEK